MEAVTTKSWRRVVSVDGKSSRGERGCQRAPRPLRAHRPRSMLTGRRTQIPVTLTSTTRCASRRRSIYRSWAALHRSVGVALGVAAPQVNPATHLQQRSAPPLRTMRRASSPCRSCRLWCPTQCRPLRNYSPQTARGCPAGGMTLRLPLQNLGQGASALRSGGLSDALAPCVAAVPAGPPPSGTCRRRSRCRCTGRRGNV